MPEALEQWVPKTPREILAKIGAKAVYQDRYVAFQLADVAVSKCLFQKTLDLIDERQQNAVPV